MLITKVIECDNVLATKICTMLVMENICFDCIPYKDDVTLTIKTTKEKNELIDQFIDFVLDMEDSLYE